MKIKKIVLAVVALVLVAAMAVIGTVAYLNKVFNPITNIFTSGKVKGSFTETPPEGPDGTYLMIPDTDIKKDPTVKMFKGSQPYFLFVQMDANESFGKYLTYEMESDWTKLTLEGEKAPVVYFQVSKTELAEDKTYQVLKGKGDGDLKNGYVHVKKEFSELEPGESTPTLTVRPAAIQTEGFLGKTATGSAAEKLQGDARLAWNALIGEKKSLAELSPTREYVTSVTILDKGNKKFDKDAVVELAIDETYQLTASIEPDYAEVKDVIWSSDKESIATVDATGKITAVAEGEAIITCKAKDTGKVSASIKVKVSTFVDGYYLVGKLNGTDYWTVANLTSAMRLAPDAEVPGQYVLDWTFFNGDGIKVAKVESGAITAWYKDGIDEEYKITAASGNAGDGTLHFCPEGNVEWTENNYMIVIPKN